MNRRTDHVTAEKVSIALLIRTALGGEAGLSVALRSGIPFELIQAVFGRMVAGARVSKPGIDLTRDRRQQPRK